MFEKIQTAIEPPAIPPPAPFSENILQFFLKNHSFAKNCNNFFWIENTPLGTEAGDGCPPEPRCRDSPSECPPPHTHYKFSENSSILENTGFPKLGHQIKKTTFDVYFAFWAILSVLLFQKEKKLVGTTNVGVQIPHVLSNPVKYGVCSS